MSLDETTPLVVISSSFSSPNETINSSTDNNRGWTKMVCPSDLHSAVILGILGISAIAMFSSFVVMAPGEVGVATTFGHAHGLSEGINVVAPMVTKVQTLSTKTQKLESVNKVPTREGLAVSLDLAIIYRLDPSKVVQLVTTVGPEYATILIEPESTSALRILTADAEAKALYTDSRQQIQIKLKQMLMNKLSVRGVVVEDVLLKDVKLPQLLADAIEMKAQAEQDAMKMKFVLEKEKQEAERKAIEAKGIAEFQSIVTSGISPELLQWKGIEATEKIAESPNSKIVIMGNSKGELPVLLNAAVDD
uniref:Prohibitin n=1 Tax=Helicotheca tamesis TaxID=374047 RepID=A0A7S2H7B2_9STRA|mmetsp:Transcript_1579/g.2256  ORF Transcript_1579/g.2256 Transcript_1579/m.2256 type:complete len:306 (+) Transcript_1579:74-991(+)